MPITEAPQGLKFWLTDRNGNIIPTYDMPANDTNDQFPKGFEDIDRSVKYVEATHDQHYIVHFKKDRDFNSNCDHLAIAFVMDDNGTELLHEPPKEGRRRNLGQDWNAQQGSFHSIGPDGYVKEHFLRFCDIVPVDNGEAPESNEKKTMGVIRAQVYRMRHSGIMKAKRNRHSRGLPEAIPQEVGSKDIAKGALITTRSAYDTRPCEKTRGVDLKLEESYQDEGKRPFFVFELRYLSKSGLIEAKVIEPDVLEGKTPQEILALARQKQRELIQSKEAREESARRSVKREQSEAPGPGPSRKKIKFKETVRYDGKPEINLDSPAEESDPEVDNVIKREVGDGAESGAETDGLFVS
ncbi:hypothetical protein PG991_010410 [Apiospora marii]|uniref:DUF7918 domain-containing protein n=1 Tax=Apiospora marii TaxID=335849 RepID=A0ABR1RIF6_9PEZI